MYMQRTILQVPMQKSLRDQAAKVAKDHGFSSLQEAIRVLLQKFSRREITIHVAAQEERLSPKAERRYAKIIEEIKKGKNITKTQSLDELFTYLNA